MRAEALGVKLLVPWEFGVAHLHGRSIPERARALIAIAHPAFREELERQARYA